MLGPYKSIIGALIRDFILLKYRRWTRKDNDEWKVPDSDKELVWGKLGEYFNFPPAFDEEVVKKSAKHIMAKANSFKNIRIEMNKLVQEDNERQIGTLTPRRTSGRNSKVYKLTHEAREASARNKANSAKNKTPHQLGSLGYTMKVPQWDMELEEMERRGITPQTADWKVRSVLYLLTWGHTTTLTGHLLSQAMPWRTSSGRWPHSMRRF